MRSKLEFTNVSSDIGIEDGHTCSIAESGEVFVPGRRGVAVYQPNGSIHIESIDVSVSGEGYWEDITTFGNDDTLKVMAVGETWSGSDLRYMHREATQWVSFFPLLPGTGFSAVLALSANEFLAAGDGFFRWGDNQMLPFSPPPPDILVKKGVLVNANEVYFGGQERQGSSVAVIHGIR